jgi:hypothetical protein
LSGPGFGGWKNRRHSHASANGINGNANATPMKMTMNKYGSGLMAFDQIRSETVAAKL